MTSSVQRSFEEHLRVGEALLETLVPTVEEVAARLTACVLEGGKVLACGNGGSAADAQHFVAELVGRFERERRALPAITLSVDPSVMTALSNDYGYEEVFARQVAALARPGDVLLGISTSGNSNNVCRAFAMARGMDVTTVALGAGDGGRMRALADLAILVPSSHTPRIQEAHITIIHAICASIEQSVVAHDA